MKGKKPLHALHPQTNLPTCRPTGNPVLASVEYRHRGDSCNAITSQLRELIARATVNVHEAVHVPDAESLDG